MAHIIGTPTRRIDGRAKVTGAAHYASDMPVSNPAYAYLVTSSIARGTIITIDSKETMAVPGVIDVMTWENTKNAIKKQTLFSKQGYASTTIKPLSEDKIWHDGQIVAVVIADTYEAAREGGNRLKVSYAEEKPSATFDAPGITAELASQDPAYKDQVVGDAAGAYAKADIKIEAKYATPVQHHNPIELFTTTCVWNGDNLTVYEPSQFMYGLKNGVAEQLGIPARNVRTVSTYVGGAFGSKGGTTPRTALTAIAAKRIGRPVKLVPTRMQGFTINTHRAETRHHVKLAASKDGKLQAYIHEGHEVTSRPDTYKVAGTSTTTRMYACPNIATQVEVVHADRNTPGFMRSPPEVPYMFALESAMDELAIALQMDPIELRRINDTQKDPVKGVPYTSRSLVQCFDAAAKAFGWSKRSAKPGSMRDGDWLIGWGAATACYPTNIGAAAARVRLTSDNQVLVQTAGHEIGTGAYTAIAIVAADKLQVPIENVTVELGDSDLPPAPVAGGSNNTASLCNCVAQACEQIQKQRGKNKGAVLEAYVENIPEGVKPEAMRGLYEGHTMMARGTGPDALRFSFGAELVEVRVHALTREIRVPRIVGAFAAGTVINPMAARSQLMGGLIWGVSSALHEATAIDPRSARYMNADLAEYLVPVNADIKDVEVILIPEEDSKVNPLGIKGLGELGNVGTNAAVANAVYHATGTRVRELPIRLEKLMGMGDA